MADYTATAICEGDHWVIDIPGVGTTEPHPSSLTLSLPIRGRPSTMCGP